MDNRDLIVVGGSAGAVDVMRQVTRRLPADLPAAILVVIHRGLQGPSMLAQILDGEGPLPAITAEEGQALERGRIYVAPPDRHLLLAQDHLHLRRGPRENRARPAIDPLFRSAAVCCSTRVIAVLLSGMLNDGTSGLLAVRRCGGIAVVQDPRDAPYAEMPRSAVRHVAVDHVVAAAEMGSLLARLAASPRPPPVEAPEETRVETLIAAQELAVMPDKGRLGSLSPLTCPECNGSMQEMRDNGLIRYRCHTGHAFTLETLRTAQNEVWERTLYSAMRAQQEQAMLARRVAEEARARQEAGSATEFERRARDYEEGAEVIRQLLAGAATTDDPEPDLEGGG
jgi:two-component system chemotaxis response regulator CheB